MSSRMFYAWNYMLYALPWSDSFRSASFFWDWSTLQCVCSTAFVSRLMLSVKNRNCLCFWCSSIALHFSLGSFCWHVFKLTDSLLGCLVYWWTYQSHLKFLFQCFLFLMFYFDFFLGFPSLFLRFPSELACCLLCPLEPLN